MRPIDADALNDAMYRKSFETDDGRQQWDSGLWIRYKVFEEALNEAPTIDAVPVVRCKDCASFHYSGMGGDNGILYCTILMTEMQPTDYCSYGKREDDD